MLDSGMTFEEWATQIDTRVVQAVPGVSVKRKIDDLFRWIHNGRECQVLALSESAAAFVALRRNGPQRRPRLCVAEEQARGLARRRRAL